MPGAENSWLRARRRLPYATFPDNHSPVRVSDSNNKWLREKDGGYTHHATARNVEPRNKGTYGCHRKIVDATAGQSHGDGQSSTPAAIAMPTGGLRTSLTLARILLLLAALGLSLWGAQHHPYYQEWEAARLPLPTLLRRAEADPYDARALYYAGLRLNEAGRFPEANPLLVRATQLAPDAARCRRELARAQVAQGRMAEAYNQLRQYVGTHPRSAEAHLMLGQFYLMTAAGKRALSELETAVSLAPNNGEAWALLAAARDEFSQDAQAALLAGKRAVTLLPTSADAYLTLGRLLSRQGKPEARQAFARAAALAPQNPEVRARYAQWLLQSGVADLASAESEARSALALRPPEGGTARALATLVLGRALVARAAYADATRVLELAARLSPRDQVPARELARCYIHLKDAAAAAHWREEYRSRQDYQSTRQGLLEAVRASPDDRERLRQLARLLARNGEAGEALRYQGLALGRVQDDPAVLVAVARELLAGGHREKALPLARLATERSPENAQARLLLDHVDAN